MYYGTCSGVLRTRYKVLLITMYQECNVGMCKAVPFGGENSAAVHEEAI